MKTTSELKRSFPKRKSTELVDEYGPQAVSYQGTNISMCMLMVLDLFDRMGAQPDIRERISVHHRSIAEGETEYGVVLLRLQGRRNTPSDIPKGALAPGKLPT